MHQHARKKNNHTGSMPQKWPLAQAAFEQGNYVRYTDLCRQIAETSDQESQKQQVLARIKQLAQDSLEVYVGLASFGLYLVAWVYALCQR